MALRPKSKTVGEIRYFTYFLRFPDGEEWIDQEPFVHELEFELQQSVFALDVKKLNDLLTKGETWWTDNNSVEHHVKIESVKRERRWGTRLAKTINRRERRRRGQVFRVK